MQAEHKYSKRVSSKYTFSEMEVIAALGKEYKLDGFVQADFSRRNVEWDEEKQIVTITIHYDQPLTEKSSHD